jgi:hypothetical protein
MNIIVSLQALIDYATGPGLFIFLTGASLHLVHRYL